MNKMIVSSSPHQTKKHNTRTIMLDVLIALVPALIASVLFFGPRVLAVAVVSIACCIVAEFCYNIIRAGKFDINKIPSYSCFDGSAAVTGLLLAMNLPSTVPLWIVPIGAVVAIVIVKMLFGGIGKNFANPALVARIFLFLSFGVVMTTAIGTSGNLIGVDAASSATWLANRSANGNLLMMFLGNTGSAAFGETSALALLIGYAYLSIRKVIDFRMPLIIIGAAFVFALLFDGLPNYQGADILIVSVSHVLSGGLILGAVFMATDYSTSPNTQVGNIIFGVCIAFLTIFLRVFSSLPEAMSFAIVIMNLLVPTIDKYILPRPYAKAKPQVAAADVKPGNTSPTGTDAAAKERAANDKPADQPANKQEAE